MTYEALMADLEQDGKCLIIAAGDKCDFLETDNNCAIYRTRPNVCVAMKPGDDQCQEVRKAEGLSPLSPPTKNNICTVILLVL